MPPDYAAEMVPFDPLVGEFRVHYAGFFDPGFGYRGPGGSGARAVLEVRSHEVPFILEHGQIVGRLVYETHAGAAGDALRHGHRLELPGPGPQALQALSGVKAHPPPLSSSAKADDPVIESAEILPKSRGLLDAPLARGRTEACRWRSPFAILEMRGRSSMVERKLPKLHTRVRFPSPAPTFAAARICRVG